MDEFNENLLNTSDPTFMYILIKWFTESEYNINKKLTHKIMNNLKDICSQFMILCQKANDDETKQYRYVFKCLADIEQFIQKTLHLSTDHAKLAWFVKGVFLANKKFNERKKYDANITRWKFYYSLMYHASFCKAVIPAKKCYRIVYF